MAAETMGAAESVAAIRMYDLGALTRRVRECAKKCGLFSITVFAVFACPMGTQAAGCESILESCSRMTSEVMQAMCSVQYQDCVANAARQQRWNSMTPGQQSAVRCASRAWNDFTSQTGRYPDVSQASDQKTLARMAKSCGVRSEEEQIKFMEQIQGLNSDAAAKAHNARVWCNGWRLQKDMERYTGVPVQVPPECQ